MGLALQKNLYLEKHLTLQPAGNSSSGPPLSALTISGTAQNFDGNSTGLKLETGAAAGSHVGYVTSSDSATITILSQSIPNLLSVTTGGHATAGTGAATAPAGSATVTYRATKSGFAQLTQTVTYTIRAARTWPMVTAPYVGGYGDSIIAQNGTSNITGLTVLNGTTTGGGELVAAFGHCPRFMFDQWFDVNNTQVTIGNVPFYTWGSNQGLSGDTVPGWTARVEGVIASQYDIVWGNIGINSTGGASADPVALAAQIFATYDLIIAAQPTVRIVVGTVRPTAVALLISRGLTNILALNALIVTGVAARSANCILGDIFTAAANNPVAASNGQLTFSAQPANGSSFVLNGQTVTFVTGAPGAGQAQIGGTLIATLDAAAALVHADPVTYASEAVRSNSTILSFAGTSNTLMTLTTGGTINATAAVVKSAANQSALDSAFLQPNNAPVPAGGAVPNGNDGLHPQYEQNSTVAAPFLGTIFNTLIDSGVPNPIVARVTPLPAVTSAIRLFTGASVAVTPANGASGFMPTGWSAGGFAGQNSSCVFSLEANAETGGQNIVWTITTGGAGLSERFFIRPTSINFAASALANNWGQQATELQTDNSIAWLMGIVVINPTTGGANDTGSVPLAGLGSGPDNRNWSISYPRIFEPSVTSCGFTLTLSFNCSIVAPGTVIVARTRQMTFGTIPDLIALHKN